MKAVRVATGSVVAPFLDPVGEVPIANVPLAEAQRRAVEAAGLTLVDTPPAGEPYFAFSDRVWFTRELVEKVVAHGPGRLQIGDARWRKEIGAELVEVGVFADGPPEFSRLPPKDVPLELEEHPIEGIHAAMAHAARPVIYGRALVLPIEHWAHLLVANHLALSRLGDDGVRAWKALGIFGKAWRALRWLLRAPRWDKWGLMRAVNEVGRDTEIHPSAVVEVSRIGDRCKIGPHAVVRGSVLGNDVTIDEHASVNVSILGDRAKVGRYGFVNLSVLYEDAMVSTGGGYQVSIFGRGSFVAWGATALDLSFGRTVPIFHEGRRQDSGRFFLGVAVGHRARVLNGVRVNYGMAIPNDAVLVADADALLRDWADAPVGEPVRVEGGRAVPIKKP